MGPVSKTSCNTCSRCIRQVDAVVKLKLKKMLKEDDRKKREQEKKCISKSKNDKAKNGPIFEI